MTTVKILKSERAIISDVIAGYCVPHSFTDIEGDVFFVNLNIDTDSPVICWIIATSCGEKIQEAIVKQEPAMTPDRLLEIALNKDVDIDRLERLIAMKERWDKDQAEKAFFHAMTEFQNECPDIRKTKEVVIT